MFLTVTLRNPKAGADLARGALGLNPISAKLWYTLREPDAPSKGEQAYALALAWRVGLAPMVALWD